MGVTPLTDLELSVIRMLLDGDDPALATLRDQLEHTLVQKRQFTGVGFFADLRVSGESPPAAASGHLGDDAEIEGLEHGAGFVLFIEDGYLHMLEGYTYGSEPWPDRLDGGVSLRYWTPGGRELRSLLK